MPQTTIGRKKLKKLTKAQKKVVAKEREMIEATLAGIIMTESSLEAHDFTLAPWQFLRRWDISRKLGKVRYLKMKVEATLDLTDEELYSRITS